MTKTNDFRVVVMMAALALAVSAAALVLVGPPASAANTLVVDDDGEQCENATFTSIQSAVDVAGEGDLIRVCPGEYHESVVVDTPLTLAADDRDALDALGCFDPAVATLDPTQHAIVDPAGSGFSVAFKLKANDIDLSGFVVQGASVGIDSSDSFSGYRVHHNLIRQNTLFGMDFGSEGTLQSRVDHNCFRDAAPRTDTGTTSWGLVSELDDDSLWVQSVSPIDPSFRSAHARDLINASIDHNSTFRNDAGLDTAGPGKHNQVTFANNVSREDNTSIVIQNSKGSHIVDNELSPSLRSGISVGGSNEDLEIARNVVTSGQNAIFFNGPNPGLFDRFTGPTTYTMVTENTVTSQRGSAIVAQPGAGLQDSYLLNNTATGSAGGSGIFLFGGNNNNELRGNTVSGNAGSGIGLQRATNDEILGNTANGNTLDGIQLQVGSTDNEVRGNTANDNGRSGIRAFPGATGNTFEENSMHGNGWNLNALGPRVDARDDNPLLEDGSLQNIWLNNDCDTDFPVGRICGV